MNNKPESVYKALDHMEHMHSFRIHDLVLYALYVVATMQSVLIIECFYLYNTKFIVTQQLCVVQLLVLVLGHEK